LEAEQLYADHHDAHECMSAAWPFSLDGAAAQPL
jgi:hypothetical protein